jgi:hypothetical protein
LQGRRRRRQFLISGKGEVMLAVLKEIGLKPE